MKRQSFQTKRRHSGSGLFVFHTRTRRRKKQRVAAGASADLGSEVPNLGVARALFVILILHLAAIAAIFIHNRVTDQEATAAANEAPHAASVLGGHEAEKLPIVPEGEDYYIVGTGDTYARIAAQAGVEVSALRDLNDNVKLKAGRILRVPPGGVPQGKRAVAQRQPESAPPAAVSPSPEPQPAPSLPVERVPAPAAPTLVKPNPAAAGGGAQEARPIVVKRRAPAPAVRVVVDPKPARSESADQSADPAPAPPRAVPVSESGGATHTVKAGDTAWAISQRYKISADQLLEANGISDARKLRVGMKLKIPSN